MPGKVDLDTDSMPSAILPDETDEQRRQRRITAAIASPGFRSAAMGAATRPANASPATPGTPTMPPAGTLPPVRSDANAVPLTGRARDLALGATSHPKMPAVGMGPRQPIEDIPAPDLGTQRMPPAGGLNLPAPAGPEKPVMPPVTASAQSSMPPAGRAEMAAPANTGAVMPPANVGPQQKAYNDLSAAGEPKLSGWKKVLDTIGSIFPIGRAVETAIPGSPQNYDFKLGQAGMRAAKEQMLGKGEQEAETARAQAQFNTPEKRRAYMEQNPDLFEGADKFQINDFIAQGKFPQREPAPEKTTDKKIDEYTNDKGQRVLTFQRANGETYDRVGGPTQPKPAGHTSAFEAFAYGSPEERKAAQDYLELEKKLGARYKTPSEFDEKFRLFKEDPDTYKAMFGDKDKTGAPDRATATKMLSYFDRRRREINQDFTLDDAQKQEQLKDIENLEKPFMDAVQPGAGSGRTDAGGAGEGHHRVRVISPDGKEGTVPLSQLKDAKKKGYRVAP
jgi:hypothetical protein